MSKSFAGLLLVTAGAIVALVVLQQARHDSRTPEAGIPREVADSRVARVTDLRYDVSFAVPDAKAQPVRGRLTATFQLRGSGEALPFDFAQTTDHLLAVNANGTALPPAVVNGHVLIPAEALRPGRNAVEFEFVAGNQSLNRGDDFMYTLFVPARASLAMPCFDQPSLKARWTLSLDIPSAWAAVANGAETGRRTSDGRTEIDFAETEPLPTYLFAFAAGHFQVETAVRDGREFHMFHRETDAAKVARNRDAIFDLHARALSWLEAYTGIPYRFGKFDFVLIPSFQFGGMEHAGAIFYNASSLLLDETATENQRLGRANVISHETAHLWFGDLVTMAWFNDVWMKEVFANFMAAKIVNPSFPDVNHDLRFLLQNYPTAYDVDRTAGANPIRQPLDNLDEAGSLYGAIIYQKAPIVMRQLELLMGADAFRAGLRDYLAAHEFGNATWPDLVRTLGAHTDVDVAAWSRAWIDEPARPRITTVLDVADGRVRRLAFRQDDPRGRGLTWPQKITVLVATPSGARHMDVTLTGAETAVPEATGLDAPLFVLPVSGGLGYGEFDLDPATVAFLTAPDGPALRTGGAGALSDVDRGAALVALWEAMLEGDVAPDRLRDLLLARLPDEPVELNVQTMLGQLRSLFWRFTTPADRASIAGRVEAVLASGLADARTASLKSAWFNALEGVATTPATLERLERVWRHDETIPGLPLSEADEAELAMELAVRDVPNASAILSAELERIKNPDRRARFAFVMPALSRDPDVRAGFFNGLADITNRAHEAWVLEGLSYLNHPLRADASMRFITPALLLVREIQRTGDIFFPKRWADASLRGYQSPEAAAMVRAFLNGLPADYPPRLRWVIETSADPLFRASGK